MLYKHDDAKRKTVSHKLKQVFFSISPIVYAGITQFYRYVLICIIMGHLYALYVAHICEGLHILF